MDAILLLEEFIRKVTKYCCGAVCKFIRCLHLMQRIDKVLISGSDIVGKWMQWHYLIGWLSRSLTAAAMQDVSGSCALAWQADLASC